MTGRRGEKYRACRHNRTEPGAYIYIGKYMLYDGYIYTGIPIRAVYITAEGIALELIIAAKLARATLSSGAGRWGLGWGGGGNREKTV